MGKLYLLFLNKLNTPINRYKYDRYSRSRRSNG